MSEAAAAPKKFVTFNREISLGSVVSLLMLMATGLWYAAHQDQKINEFDRNLGEIRGDIGRLSDTLNRDVVRIDNRIDGILEVRK